MVLKYYASYHALKKPRKPLNILNNVTFAVINVDYDTWYKFEIQVESQGGKSNTESISWLSHSGK